ncbi:MAG: alkaline phosphatase PhoX, partial [Cytophagales bacterium]
CRDKKHIWKYLDDGSEQGTAWIDPQFDDSDWKAGMGPLGYSFGDISTEVSFGDNASNKHITTYFRTKFNITSFPQTKKFKLTLRRDDGVVLYLNGKELLRTNMPTGPVNSQTWSVANQMATDIFYVSTDSFKLGENHIAASVHQRGPTSSDLLFALSIEDVAPEKFLIDARSIWKYLDLGVDPGASWTTAGFNDASWKEGYSPLGYAFSGLATTISFGPNSGNKYRTSYFRKKVEVKAEDLEGFEEFSVRVRIDDGMILYLNGNEIMRRNMPTGNVTNTTFASVTVGSTPATFTTTISKTLLLEGENIFAARVHQVSNGSSDKFFELEILPIIPDVVAIPFGSEWSFNDKGENVSETYFNPEFDFSAWEKGNAPLGYGFDNLGTKISFGSNPVNKHITTYFVKEFQVSNLSKITNVLMKIRRDDGVVVYLNGERVAINNLLEPFNNSSTAVFAIEGEDEINPITINLKPNRLVQGRNVIAVEIHKFRPYESDKLFDLELLLQLNNVASETPNSFVLACDPNSSEKIACFTSVTPTVQNQFLVMPSTHTFQMIAQQGNGIYSNSSRNMPGTHDFTGYHALNGSSRAGIVSVNHENSPGDVSLLSVRFNEETKLWVMDSARLVDFSELVRTQRNCSGGVTPWGTIITSEENTEPGDANGDGYQDVGWQVEIDPVSGKIVDYDGDGKPDKIWAMGRMNHENISLSSDSSVAYQAEDGGTGCVYKYVLDKKANMSSGKLYVLSRTNSTSTTGKWIQVPNTTIAERNAVASTAGSLGGTNWGGPEDIEIGNDGMIYFTAKNSGTIWRFSDNGDTISNLEAWVTNRSYPILTANGVVNENFGTGIDNLAFDEDGNCWAFQDGGRNHIWVIRPGHSNADPKVDLFATTPAGSEPCGLTFTPDFRYGFFSIQHPSSSNTTFAKDAAGRDVRFNAAATVVFARKEFLGSDAVEPRFALELKDTTLCGNEVEIGFEQSTDKKVIRFWEDGTSGTSRLATQSGVYKVKAFSDNGRSFIDSVVVTLNPNPEINIDPISSVCGDSLVIVAGTNDFEYDWSFGATDSAYVFKRSEEFSLNKKDKTTGCETEKELRVVLNEIPSILLADMNEVCGDSIVLIAGNNEFTYDWSIGGSDSVVVVRNSSKVSVEKTNKLTGCDASKEVEVVLNPLPNIVLPMNASICATCDSVVLDAGEGFVSYKWSNDAETRTITVTQEGDFSVTVKDDKGCENNASVSVSKITSISGLSFGKNKLALVVNNDNSMSVALNVSQSGEMNVNLFDIQGNKIATLHTGSLSSGAYVWNLNEISKSLRAGNYLVVAESTQMKDSKLVVVK